MLRIACIAASVVLLTTPDVSRILQANPQAKQQEIPPNETIPVLPKFDAPPDKPQDQPQAATSEASGPLTEESRLAIIRYVSGEFAHMVVSLPAGKKGFHIKAGDPVDNKSLQDEIRANGAVLNAGDNAQITKIDFGSQDIRLEVNGGPKGKDSWRNRVRLTTGDDAPVSTSTSTAADAAPATETAVGAVLYVDFGRPLPNVTSDQVKKYLAVVFDFTGERSAAVEWAAGLPPDIRAAVEEKRAAVGMDHDQVMAALGRPDRKVREEESDGTETEDWIYGHPPIKTIFVLFSGDKVIKVSQYP